MSFVAYGAFKKERSFFMKKISGFFKAIGRYFKNFGVAFAKGDIWVKLSAVIMGAGYFARKQIVNGLIMLIVEAAFVLMCVGYAAPNLAKFGTLGTVKFEQVFDPLTMQTTTNNYDNSFHHSYIRAFLHSQYQDSVQASADEGKRKTYKYIQGRYEGTLQREVPHNTSHTSDDWCSHNEYSADTYSYSGGIYQL